VVNDSECTVYDKGLMVYVFGFEVYG